MKRLVYLLCTTTIVFSLSGCTQRFASQNNQIKTIDKKYGTNLGVNNTPRSDLSVAPGATQIGTAQGVTTASYKDGTYTGHSDMTPYGRQVATVTISGGRIVGVTLSSVDNNNDNYYSVKDNPSSTINTAGSRRGDATNNPVGGVAQGSAILGRTNQDNSDVRKTLADSVIQSQTYNIDISSNNPEAVNNWKTAVKRALEQAQK
jgi:uncharacterized protein with FMN-binding domain